MGKDNMPGLARSAAHTLYGWYMDRVDAVEAADYLHNWVAQINSDVGLSARHIASALTRLKKLDTFTEEKAAFISRWRKPFDVCHERPGVRLAELFLNDWIESLDHSVIFSQTVLAGFTRVVADKPGDSTNLLYGKRDFWMLHLTMEGSVVYTVDREINAGVGDLVLMGPSAHCHYRRNVDHSVWKHAWAVYSPRPELMRWMEWPAVGEGIFLTQIGNDNEFEILESLLRQIGKLSDDDAPLSDEICFNLMEQVLIRINRTSLAQESSSLDPRVQRACDYLRSCLGSAVTVEEIAGHCNVSASRLSHLFKQNMGVGLQQYRNGLRMQYARKLLVTTQLQVASIAAQTGYSDPTQFSKYFQKENGCSPRQFRKQSIRSGENKLFGGGAIDPDTIIDEKIGSPK